MAAAVEAMGREVAVPVPAMSRRRGQPWLHQGRRPAQDACRSRQACLPRTVVPAAETVRKALKRSGVPTALVMASRGTLSGGSGIRTHGDGLRHDGFQDRILRPLGHPPVRGTRLAAPCTTRHNRHSLWHTDDRLPRPPAETRMAR